MTRPLLASALMLAAWALYPPPEPAWTAEPPTPVLAPATSPRPVPRPLCREPVILPDVCIYPSSWRP